MCWVGPDSLVASEMRSYAVVGLLLAFTSTALAACGKGATTVNWHEVCEKKIIFEDDFSKDMRALNKNWKIATRFSGYPDHEFNYYVQSKDTISITEGALNLSPTLSPKIKDNNDDLIFNGEIDLNDYPPNARKCSKEPDSGFCKKKANGYQILPPVVTTRIFSRKSFRYGTVEVRAKVPKGDWIYPEIELIPIMAQSRYGKKSGRIIIAMVRGNEELRYPGTDERINFGANWLEAGIFAGKYNPRTASHMVATVNETAWSDDFHTYRVDWEPGMLTFYVDDELIGKGTVKTEGLLPSPMSANAPADEEMVVALGIGVGGIQRFPDGVVSNGVPKPWKNLSPKAMLSFWAAKESWYPTWKAQDSSLKVDYVKVWSRDMTKASLQARPRP